MNWKILLPTLLAIFLVTFLVLGVGIDKPFNGHHDYNNRSYQRIANNYLEKGLWELRLGQLDQPKGYPIVEQNFYTHHPPFLTLSLAGFIALLGDSERTVRLLPIVSSALSVFIFLLLLKRHFSWKVTLIASAFWFVTPMFRYFGKMADHEAITLLFIVASVYCFDLWQRSKNKRAYYFLLAFIFLGQWSGWPAYFLAGVLFLLTRSFGILLLTILDVVLFFLWVQGVTGSVAGGGLINIFLFRIGVASLQSVQQEYTLSQFVIQEVRWLYHFFTPVQFITALLAAVITGALFIKGKVTKQNKSRLTIWLIFTLVAVLHVVVFRNGAFRHDYWLYYFLPVFSWGVAEALTMLYSKFKKYSLAITLLGVTLLIVSFWQKDEFFWALQNRIQPVEEQWNFTQTVDSTPLEAQ